MKKQGNRKLLEAMSLIDGKYIDDFNDELKRRKKLRTAALFRRIAGIAACLCVVVCAVLIGVRYAEPSVIDPPVTGTIHGVPEGDFEIENGRLISYRGTGTEVVIPDGVTEITATSFSSSSSDITSVSIGKNVISVDVNAFAPLRSLREIKVAEGNPGFVSKDGIMGSIDGTAYFCAALTAREASYKINGIIMEMQRDTENFGKAASLSLGNGVMTVRFEETAGGSADCYVTSVKAFGHEVRFDNYMLIANEFGVGVRQTDTAYIISLYADGSDEVTYIFTEHDVYEIMHADTADEDQNFHTRFVIRSTDREVFFDGEQLDWRRSAVFCEDLTGDGVPEISVMFVNGTGTGVHTQDVHIFDSTTLEEYEIEDMTKTLADHVAFGHDDSSYTITTSEGTKVILKSDLDSEPDHLAEDVVTGMYYHYTVKDGKLRYITGCTVSMTESHGNIDVTYRFDGDKFVYESSKWYKELPEWVIVNGFD